MKTLIHKEIKKSGQWHPLVVRGMTADYCGSVYPEVAEAPPPNLHLIG